MLDQFISSFTECAHASGITRVQFYVEQINEERLHLFQSDLERMQLADLTLVYIEGEYQGLHGSTFVENLDLHLFDEHIANIKQTAEYNNVPFSPRRSQELTPPQTLDNTLPLLLLVDKLKAAEAAAYAVDERIKLVRDCSFISRSKRITLIDDLGDKMEDYLHFCRVGTSVVAEDGAQVQTAGKYSSTRNIDKLDMIALAQAAATRAVSMLGAAPVKTGDYPVIIQNEVVCDLLLTFLPAFFADRVQNAMSRLKGKLGEQVASSAISLLEDPTFELGIITRRFDDEALPTSRKAIIENGVLKNYFHNLQTARKAGVAPTGNGFKRDYTEKPTISPTNIYLCQGTSTLAELQRQMGDGLLITECDGMFAGADPVSGDFSLISKGFVIKDGRVERPVAQITVSGNFFDMLRQVAGIGNDYASVGSENGFATAPSILIPSLTISGE